MAPSLRRPAIPTSEPGTIPVIYLAKFGREDEEAIKSLTSKIDTKWPEKPDFTAPPLSYTRWTTTEEGNLQDIYAIAKASLETAADEGRALIFVDSKILRDQTVVITYWHGDILCIRRILAGRAGLALKYCILNSTDFNSIPSPPTKFGKPWWKMNDPGKPPFNDDVEGNWYGSASHPPTEVAADLIPSETSLLEDRAHVISLVPSTFPGLDALIAAEKNTTFYPWAASHPGTRTDLCNLFRLFPETPLPPPKAVYQQHRLFLIPSPTKKDTLSLVRASQMPGRQIDLCLLPLTAIDDAWKSMRPFDSNRTESDKRSTDKISNLTKSPQKQETLLNYNMGMYDAMAKPWECDDWDQPSSPPVFFLFDASDDEKQQILKELRTFDDDGIEEDLYESGDGEDFKHFCIVPFSITSTLTSPATSTQKLSAQELQILQITKHTDTTLAVFVDAQTLEDNTVILSDGAFKFERDPVANDGRDRMTDWRGVEYARLPGRRVHIDWINLSIANMGLDEYADAEGVEMTTLGFELLDEGL